MTSVEAFVARVREGLWSPDGRACARAWADLQDNVTSYRGFGDCGEPSDALLAGAVDMLAEAAAAPGCPGRACAAATLACLATHGAREGATELLRGALVRHTALFEGLAADENEVVAWAGRDLAEYTAAANDDEEDEEEEEDKLADPILLLCDAVESQLRARDAKERDQRDTADALRAQIAQACFETERQEQDAMFLAERAFSRGVVRETLELCSRFRRPYLVEHVRIKCLAAMGRQSEACAAAIHFARIATGEERRPGGVVLADSDVISALDAVALPRGDLEIDDLRRRVRAARV
jgi:hypothetical protein